MRRAIAILALFPALGSSFYNPAPACVQAARRKQCSSFPQTQQLKHDLQLVDPHGSRTRSNAGLLLRHFHVPGGTDYVADYSTEYELHEEHALPQILEWERYRDEFLPLALISASVAGMVSTVVACNGFCEQVPTLDIAAIGQNIPIAAVCAGVGDILAQLTAPKTLEPKFRIRTLDLKRTANAAFIAGVLQGAGSTVWINHLNVLIPGESIGFSSFPEALGLACKCVTDSMVWGTITNSLAIVLNRRLAGDSTGMAITKWQESILQVTGIELRFWPVFGSMVYCYVPDTAQVGAFAAGGVLWSIYLSIIANSAEE